MAWRVLLTALNRIENSDGQAHIIDPKAISKDDLYGYMDQNTRKTFDSIGQQTNNQHRLSTIAHRRRMDRRFVYTYST
jgi:hypothetical protein